MDWGDLNLVLAICRSGTFSGAAKSLGINHTTVFRRINAIEKKLQVRLFDCQPSPLLRGLPIQGSRQLAGCL